MACSSENQRSEQGLNESLARSSALAVSVTVDANGVQDRAQDRSLVYIYHPAVSTQITYWEPCTSTFSAQFASVP